MTPDRNAPTSGRPSGDGPLSENALRAAFQRGRDLPPARSADSPPTGPVSLDALQALVEGRIPAADRPALLARVLADPDTARELRLLQAVHVGSAETGADTVADGGADAGTASMGRGLAETVRRRWFAAGAVSLAAAAALAVVMVPRAGQSPLESTGRVEAVRGGTSRRAPTLLAPAAQATATAGTVLRWTSVMDADRYVVELVGGDGSAVARLETVDTTLAIPATLTPAQLLDATGWWVIAQRAGSDQSRSGIRLFATPRK